MYKDEYDNLQLRLSTESKKNLVFPGSCTTKVNPSNHFIVSSLFFNFYLTISIKKHKKKNNAFDLVIKMLSKSRDAFEFADMVSRRPI